MKRFILITLIALYASTYSYSQTSFGIETLFTPIGITNSKVTLKQDFTPKDRFDITAERTFGLELNGLLVRNNNWRFKLGYSMFRWNIGFRSYHLHLALQPPNNKLKEDLELKNSTYFNLYGDEQYLDRIYMDWNILMHGPKISIGKKIIKNLNIDFSLNFYTPKILSIKEYNTYYTSNNSNEAYITTAINRHGKINSPQDSTLYRVTSIYKYGENKYWEMQDFIVPEVSLEYKINRWSSLNVNFGYKFYSKFNWHDSFYSMNTHGNIYSSDINLDEQGSSMHFSNRIQYLNFRLGLNFLELFK